MRAPAQARRQQRPGACTAVPRQHPGARPYSGPGACSSLGGGIPPRRFRPSARTVPRLRRPGALCT
eukprot:949730-Lingulodinium_polyedra.AAC.1